MKKIFFILTFLIFSAAAFAEIQLLPSEGEKPRQYIQVQVGAFPKINTIQSDAIFAAEYNFSFEPFAAFAGIQTDGNLFDATLRAEWAPFVFTDGDVEWRFGGVFGYNIQRDPKYSTEHNFMFETSAHCKTKSNFTFTARLGYSLKYSRFDSIKDFGLINHNITIVHEFDKIWSNGIELFAAISSCSDFNYPLFFCPQAMLGVAYNPYDMIRFAIQIECGTTDFLSSVLHINYALIRFTMRYSF